MTKQSDAHGALAHDAYRAGSRYYPRKIGDTYAIGDGEIGEYIRKDLSESDAYRIARELSGRAILSVIAERLGDVTEAMERAGFGPIRYGGRTGPIDKDFLRQEIALSDFRKILAASPLVPGDGK